jgi:hypothetical protein
MNKVPRGTGKNISKMQAEGPKKRMIRTSTVSPKRRGEGTVPSRKRNMMERASANKKGPEGPKRNTRQTQNLGVASGTLRRGAGGKTMRRYNASTGRWDVVGNVGKYK